MSHSLSSQVHSTKAASASNVSPLHHSGSTTVKVAPRSVLVNWSESSRLNEGEEFPFSFFIFKLIMQMKMIIFHLQNFSLILYQLNLPCE
ncbi:hypothetical protein CU052_27225 [Vibrio harveyi]|uniref:hypothetical protein n=1 Tax=Vibrio harveyi TaxID=669 RepID=UPI000C7A13BA|nr:hypothetical protein [Vibrio harveyi]AWB02841.1 hypothetical protein CU052_27225 [Vibrio harveyi]